MSYDLKEINEAISNIHHEIFECHWEQDEDDEIIYISCFSNAYRVVVKFLDIPIWGSDNDRRDVISDNGDKEPLEPHLRKMIMAEIEKIRKINLA
tara:strand:+ start:1686 stop:1970 length:285 start_codon:yes stop_codon:yes gene_type:complete